MRQTLNLNQKDRIKKILKDHINQELKTCANCDITYNGKYCFICEQEKLLVYEEREYQSSERIRIERNAKKKFNFLKLRKTEITDSKDKIYFLDYDIETSNIDGQRGWITYWNATCCHGLQQKGYNAKSLVEMIHFLYKQRRQIVIRAHNGIRFDLTFFWRQIIKELALEKKKPRVYGNWAMVSWKNILHIDTCRIFTLELAKWPCTPEQQAIKDSGQDLWKEKEYIEGNYSTEFYAKLATYCDNDVLIQKTAIDKLNYELKSSLEEITGKVLPHQNKMYKKGTQAGLGLYFLRQIIPHQDFNRFFPELFDEKEEFLRKCYEGASVDSWNEQRWEGKTHAFDLNSAYAGEMKKNPMPTGFGKWVNIILQTETEKIKDTGNYQIEIRNLKLNEKLNKIPLIYFKEDGVARAYSEIKNKILYCNGAKWKFISQYYTGEWIIVKGIEFEPLPNIFNQYVDYWSQKKDQAEAAANDFNRLFAKLMLNCLYGRFGLRTIVRNYQLVSKERKNVLSNKAKFLHPINKDYMQWELGKETKINSFSYVPVAIQVVSQTWIKLMKAAIANEQQVLYWDSDCLILKTANFILPAGQEIGFRLGQWKVKTPVQGWVCYTNKLYKLGDKVKSAGISKYGRPHIGWEEKQSWIMDRNTETDEWGVRFKIFKKTVPQPINNRKREFDEKVALWKPILSPPPIDFKKCFFKPIKRKTRSILR